MLRTVGQSRGFKIRYYRDRYWAQMWERAGVYKPEGYVTSTAPSTTEQAAREAAAQINSHNPTYPCLVVRA